MILKPLLLLLALIVASMRLCAQLVDAPDPKVLLQGIAAIREQTPPSHLHIRAVWDGPLWRNDEEYLVLFKGDLRYFAMTNASRVSRILWDGKDVLRFDGGGVNLRNLDTQTGDYLFDPRVLGITTSYAWSDRIRGSLRLGASQSRIELVGREEIDSKAAWHVRIGDNDCEINIWIDEKSAFSVYRYDEKWRYGHRTTRSFYENPDYAWLPSRVEGEEFDAKGQLICKRRISILAANAKINVPENTFTLAGLLSGVKLKPGIWLDIIDVRTDRIVGYWHEGRLEPLVPRRLAPGDSGLTPKRLVIMTVMALLLMGPIIVFWLKRARTNKNPAKPG